MPLGAFRLLVVSDAAVTLSAGPWRAGFVQHGRVELSPSAAVLNPGEARAFGRSALSCAAQEAGTLLWVWEWTEGVPGPVPAGAGLALSYDVLSDPAVPDRPVLLRMERVALHPGAVTARHTHAGCGLRVLVEGHIDAQVGDRHLSLSPGDFWLERGPDEPVIGRAGPDGATFVRVMVLADGMQGQDSYRPWGDDTDRRGRPASYQKFFEAEVD